MHEYSEVKTAELLLDQLLLMHEVTLNSEADEPADADEQHKTPSVDWHCRSSSGCRSDVREAVVLHSFDSEMYECIYIYILLLLLRLFLRLMLLLLQLKHRLCPSHP
jgi:hypothetical protein